MQNLKKEFELQGQGLKKEIQTLKYDHETKIWCFMYVRPSYESCNCFERFEVVCALQGTYIIT